HDQLFRRDEEIAAGLAAVAPTAPARAIVVKHLPYELLLQRIRQMVRNAVPEGAHVLVISKGDDALLRLEASRGMHFPQAAGGVYAGYHPANSEAAVRHLEQLRTAGAQYLLLPQTSLWWLEHYREFGEHLNRNYMRVMDQPDLCVLFDLN